jgi:endonuclease/exonuclease/phosphatase family metal-dependent hydrolase
VWAILGGCLLGVCTVLLTAAAHTSPPPPQGTSPADATTDGASPSIDIINWNTYHLFDHTTKLAEATAWMAELAPNIVALQEVLHIDEKGLGELAGSWGHDHAVMHKESGYPVALTSTQPIEVIKRVTKGYHHGYLHARTHGIDIFVVHFWPSKPHEAVAVSKKAAALVKAGRPVIVMGDFNGLIRADEAYLLEHDFGEVKDGVVTIDYQLTDAFLEKGFVELVSQHSPDDLYTFGAPALIPRWAKTLEECVARRRRIDYIFASPDLAKASTSAHVITDDTSVGLYSDHYPVVCRVKCRGDG